MPSIDELNKRLDSAGEGTQPWKPSKEGDQIAGKVTVRGSFTHSEYGTSPTLTIEVDEGSVIMDGKAVKDQPVMRVLMAGTVLGGFTTDNEIVVGDWVAIRYLGKKVPNSGGKPYNNFATLCEKPTASTKLDDAASSDFA
jgi:hypothetical protein